MCLKALTSFVTEAVVYFDLDYARGIKMKEKSLINLVEPEFVASDLLASAEAQLESHKTVSAPDIRSCSLDRLVRKIRPSHQLQRNSTNSSNRSDCSERLHEYLRLQESLSSFPKYQKSSSLFWRKQPAKGKHRSLQGKTVPRIPP